MKIPITMKVFTIKAKWRVRDIVPILMIFLLGLTSCANYEKPLIADDIPEVVSLSEDLVPFFETSCAKSGCHATGSVPPDLTENNAYLSLTNGGYVNINIPDQSTIYTKINTGGTMEQFSTPRDTKVVLRWIEQGAENN